MPGAIPNVTEQRTTEKPLTNEQLEVVVDVWLDALDVDANLPKTEDGKVDFEFLESVAKSRDALRQTETTSAQLGALQSIIENGPVNSSVKTHKTVMEMVRDMRQEECAVLKDESKPQAQKVVDSMTSLVEKLNQLEQADQE